MIASPRSHREQPRAPPRVPTSAAHMYRSPAAAGLPPWPVQDNIPASPCSDLLENDHLIDQFFDFEGYYRTSRASTVDSFPYPSPPRSPPRYSPRSSPDPLLSDNFIAVPAGTDQFGHFHSYSMASSSYGADGLSSGSEYAATPELMTGGSSPSSATSVDHFEDHHHHHGASHREFRNAEDQWTHHHADPRTHGHHSHVDDGRRYRVSESSAGLKRRHSGHSSEKRSRHLVDRLQTADVRKSGACLPCRVLKTRCAESGVCPTCRKAFPDHAHLVCNRLTPGGSWPVLGKAPDVWSQTAAAEEQLCSGPRVHFGLKRDIDVFFEDPRQYSWPHMRVIVQTYAHSHEGIRGEGSPNKVDFPNEAVPAHDKLQNWAEEQFACERNTDFESAVQTFLSAYANQGRGLPKHSLVTKVHRMNCFFKILKTPFFWCRDPKNKIVPLPLSAQAQLRNLARNALNSIEHDVLKKLDECLTQNGAPKPEERMAIWACMWQLMLMYREVAWATRTFIHNAQGYEAGAGSIRDAMEFDRKLMQSFFPLLTMFYHYQFRMKKSVELSLDWLKSSSYPSEARRCRLLFDSVEEINETRMGFYQQLQSSPDEVDQLLSVLVVQHEIKKLNARKRPSKASSRSGSSGSRSSASSSSGSKSHHSGSRSSGSSSSGSGSPRSRSSGYDSPEYYGHYYA